MIYYIQGLPRRIDSKDLDKAIEFACIYLDLNVDLVIQFTNSISKHVCGYCDYEEDEAVVTISSRLSFKETARTLFHELVHVRQFSDGILLEGSPSLWKGIPYYDDYFNLPWEVEAFELEEEMIEKFYVDILIESAYTNNVTKERISNVIRPS